MEFRCFLFEKNYVLTVIVILPKIILCESRFYLMFLYISNFRTTRDSTNLIFSSNCKRNLQILDTLELQLMKIGDREKTIQIIMKFANFVVSISAYKV